MADTHTAAAEADAERPVAHADLASLSQDQIEAIAERVFSRIVELLEDNHHGSLYRLQRALDLNR